MNSPSTKALKGRCSSPESTLAGRADPPDCGISGQGKCREGRGEETKEVACIRGLDRPLSLAKRAVLFVFKIMFLGSAIGDCSNSAIFQLEPLYCFRILYSKRSFGMSRVIHKTLYLILIFFVGLFIVSSLFVRAQYNYGLYGDNPILGTQQWSIFLPIIILLLLTGIGLYRLCLGLNKYSPKIVIPVVLLCSMAIQIAIIFVFPRVPTDDSQTVVSLAMSMLYDQDYSSFETGGYLHMFPFNFSIVLYLKTLLSLFPDNYLVIKLFNILFSTLTTLMIYLIYKQLNPNSRERDYGVLIFAATYLPSLFLNNLIYNDVIATAFLTSCLYFLLRFVREKSWKAMLCAAILLAIGNYFRSIGAIVLIAAILYILLNMRSIGFKKVVGSIAVLAILFNVPGWTQNAVLQSTGKVSEPVGENSAPSICG